MGSKREGEGGGEGKSCERRAIEAAAAADDDGAAAADDDVDDGSWFAARV